MASDNCSAKTIATIRNIALTAGLRKTKNWNLSSLLSRSKAKAIRTPDGWELTNDGRAYVATIAGPIAASPAPKIAAALRPYLSSIIDIDTRKYVEEGVEAFEHQLYRSAVVLTWVGAIALLHDHVFVKHLTAFNAEASRRNTRWQPAKGLEDLSRMKEYDFLQVIESLSIIGKNVKHQLENQLKLRNGCGHPNSLKNF